MTDEYLRPKEAAERFHVSRQTLGAWADQGLIGRSRVGGCTWYLTADIAELIDSQRTPRTITSITRRDIPRTTDWRDDDFWRDAIARARRA